MLFRRLLGSALLLLPFASATAEPIRITGRVLYERDKPLPGARLSLFSAYEGYDDALRRLTKKGEPIRLASARTDAEGAFEILAPESGCFQVVIQAEGFLSEEIALLPLVEDVELPPTTLLKVSSVNVLTVGPDGRPLAGIEIRTVESEPWGGRRFQDLLATEWHPRDPRGISDKAGRATLPWFRLYGPATVVAVTPRFLGQTAKAMTTDETITLRLSPAGSRWIEARGADGKPVPGVLARWDGWPVGMTGPDGRLEVAAPAGESALTLESLEGWHARVVRTEGKGILPVRLEPRRRIAGRVVDPQNRPVTGAVVWSGRPLAAPTVRSDAAGAFLIEIPAGEESWLQAGAAGFLPGDRRLIQQASAKPMVLTLAPAATLSGIVVDRAGRPVAGAEIVLHRMMGMRGARVRVVSRSDGRFQTTGLQPNGSIRLIATRTGFARTEATVRTAAAGQPSPPARIVMEDGQTAFGQVVDDAGQPIAGTELKLVTRLSAPLKTQSDGEGKFEFRHLSPGRISVLATHPGYAPGSLENVELPPSTPSIDLGTLRLPPGEVIEGMVTDVRGMPIEGAEVSAHQQGASPMAFFDPFDFPEPMRTKSDGSFRLEDLDGGKRINLGVRRAGYVDVSLPGVQAPTEEPLRIEMKTARALSGQVVGPEGEPVVNAGLRWVQKIGIGGGASGRELGKTDAEGKFRATGLPPGSTDLEVAAEGYADRRIEGLQIPPDKDLEDLRITLQRAILLDVLVLNGKGEPVPDVWVRAEPLEPKIVESRGLFSRSMRGLDRTDLAGRCRLTLPAPGSYQVSASGKGPNAEARVTVGAAGASVELRFPPGTEISGRVVSEDGAVISGASVHLQQTGGPGHQQRGSSTQADGTFIFSEVPDGDYQMKAQQAELTSEILDVTVSGRPVQGIELRLDRPLPGATLSGHIMGLASEDLPRLQVRAFGSNGMAGPVRPDREGAYRFDKLLPGDWQISAELPGDRSVASTVTIPLDVTTMELDLKFPQGLTLKGRVTVDGSPLSDAQVQAWGSGGLQRVGGTAYDGTFTLRDVAAGETTLVIAGSQGLGGTRTLRVTKDQEIAIDLATGRLSGRILTATGEPVEDATVNIDFQGPTRETSFSAPSARTDTAGAFEIRIVAGTYKLTISQDGFAPAELTVEVPAGGERTVEIPLNPPGAR